MARPQDGGKLKVFHFTSLEVGHVLIPSHLIIFSNPPLDSVSTSHLHTGILDS